MPGATIEVIAGSDRYATAVDVSKAAFPAGASAVVIATGRRWSDALGGAALAGVVGGPVLLAEPGRLPPVVAAEIARLGARDAYVLGGHAALGPDVESEVAAALAPGGRIVRVAGATGYETAEAVASETVAAQGAAYDGGVLIVTAAGYADAVACSAVAARAGRPVLLAPRSGLATSTVTLLRSIGASHGVVLGGEVAVSAASFARAEEALGGPGRLTRVWGSDRYGTALAFARWSGATGLGWSAPGLVTGQSFPDAMSAGPLLSRRGSVLLLTRRAECPEAVALELWARRGEVGTVTVVGGASAVSFGARVGAAQAVLAPPFDTARAMSHVMAIAGIGPRRAGSAAERAACDYVAARLREYGYAVSTQDFAIPYGRTSRNVLAAKEGSLSDVVVLGAHIDSKHPSPGGNDNASGVGVVLELARILARSDPAPTVRFVAFGAEEISGATPADHHFGSHHYVSALSSAERARVAAAISVDMVGYGTDFHVRHMQRGPATAVGSLHGWARVTGVPMTFLKDHGAYGWSDHEPFELAGMPAAWLQWRPDPAYHTVRDTGAHVQPSRVGITGRFLRSWLLRLDGAALSELH